MLSLLPPNATGLERRLEQATARIDELPVPIPDVWNPDTCPLPLLPWLAWAYSVDEWDPAWTEAQQRAVVRDSLLLHRHKGTLGALRRALGSLGYDCRIIEWFEESPRGDAGTFRIEIQINGTPIEEPLYTQMERIVDDAKNVRSHLASLRIISALSTPVYVAAALNAGLQCIVGNRSHLDGYGRLPLRTGVHLYRHITARPAP